MAALGALRQVPRVLFKATTRPGMQPVPDLMHTTPYEVGFQYRTAPWARPIPFRFGIHACARPEDVFTYVPIVPDMLIVRLSGHVESCADSAVWAGTAMEVLCHVSREEQRKICGDRDGGRLVDSACATGDIAFLDHELLRGYRFGAGTRATCASKSKSREARIAAKYGQVEVLQWLRDNTQVEIGERCDACDVCFACLSD